MASSKHMNDFFSTNKHLKNLPDHLIQYIVDQDYSEYTPIDHSVWRYVMKQNMDYLPKVIFGDYIQGLNEAGITIDRIPNLYGMNRILQKVGWAAVCVDGFIPPKAFMEFQSHKVLVIAADIRQINHIEYTPAPDILHEAAGHAPIIPNKKYSDYLELFGKIGTKAFSSSTDLKLFEAIRNLSILKEAKGVSSNLITEAERVVDSIQKKASKEKLSEMSMIRNLHWWTVEYGLIGTIDNPKIYGAGLLSSIGESVWCMSEKVKKKIYSIDSSKVNFDITKPQPQLFVTPSFEYLIDVLKEFSKNMAFKKGGEYGINQAIKSGDISTCEFDSGIQISGKFVKLTSNNGQCVYIQTEGATSLALKFKEIKNQGIDFHKEGFGAPCGKVINFELNNFNLEKAKNQGIVKNEKIEFEYESGLLLNGIIKNFTFDNNNNIILISFDDCEIKYKNHILFEKSWGKYDLIIGEKIISCYPGPADEKSFPEKKYDYKSQTIKANYSESDIKIHKLYNEVEKIRTSNVNYDRIKLIFEELESTKSQEWLLLLEICEIAKKIDEFLYKKIKNYLENLSIIRSDLKKLILDGLKIL
tara:strand:+ start:16974 stop:18728 length:1755 start_codon:yes stop_codon:yes gene_type:complete